MDPFSIRHLRRTAHEQLLERRDFGSNPGRLRALTYVPKNLPAGAPLVVVLHGCSQSADEYDMGSGWSQLAERLGFALLFPEQRRSNNVALCFNWFDAADNRRGTGEALSIMQMVTTMVARHDLDPARVYVTGLSAGGAMAAVMMATYPERFAGGAIIAGLPYGSATDMFQAMDRMHGLGGPTARQLEAKVRAASKHAGSWPVLSLWHGTADRTVAISNIESLLGQWCLLHEVGPVPTHCGVVDGYPRRAWHNVEGKEVIEAYSITGMGHGTPLDTRGVDGYGASGPFMLDAHIGSTLLIARFWGIASPEPVAELAVKVFVDQVVAPQPS